MTSRKIIIVLILVFASLVFILGLWFYFQRDPLAENPLKPDIGEFFPVDTGESGGEDENPATTGGEQGGGDNVEPTVPSFGDRLIKLATSPVTSFIVGTASSSSTLSASSTVFAYLEKTTGHIYSKNLENTDPIRLTNITLPGIVEVIWGKNQDGLTAIGSYLETGVRKNILLPKNEILSNNLYSLTSSPKGDKFFALEKITSGAAGVVHNWSDNTKKEVWLSGSTEWLVDWPKIDLLSFNSKPSGNIPGHLYFLNPETKVWQPVLSNIFGLNTKVSPDGSKILYSESLGKTVSAKIYNLKDQQRLTLGLETFSEKCVWSKNSLYLYCAVPNNLTPGLYPDDWYTGEKMSPDAFWWINAETGETRLSWQTDFGLDENLSFDAVDLKLNQEENRLFFINRRDSSLWSLSLE